MIIDASLVIRSRDTVNEIINNLNKSLSYYGRNDSNFMFVVEKISLFEMTNFENETSAPMTQSTNVEIHEFEPEKLEGYEKALIVLGTLFGICFIFFVVFLVLKFFKQNFINKSVEPLYLS